MNNSLALATKASSICKLLNEIFDCFIFLRDLERTSNNTNRFASLLVIAGDFTAQQVASFTIQPINKDVISDKDIREMNERLYELSRNGSLRKNVKKLLLKQTNYRSKDLATLKEWTPLIKAYINNNKLVNLAEKILNISIEIDSEKLEQLTTSLLNKINHNEEELVALPTLPNRTINIITQEDLLELMISNTPVELREYINFNDVYDYFPEIIIVNGDVEVLPFLYATSEYEVNLLVTILKTPCITGFEFTIGITDWESDLNLYQTEFQKVPIVALAKFFEDLFQERNIDFINYLVLEKLRTILNHS